MTLLPLRQISSAIQVPKVVNLCWSRARGEQWRLGRGGATRKTGEFCCGCLLFFETKSNISCSLFHGGGTGEGEASALVLNPEAGTCWHRC